MMGINFSCQWLLLYWQIRSKNFTVCQHVSSIVFYLTVDTLCVSFVSPGCLQESKVARITVAAGRSDLLIMGWGSDVAG